MKKRIIGVSLACLTAGMVFAGCGGSSDTAQETTTAEETTVETETTTEAPKFANDMEIITKEGHPVILDNYDLVKDFWDYDLIRTGKVAYNATNSEGKQYETILYLIQKEDRTNKNSVLGHIEVDVDDMEDVQSMDVNQASEIAIQYLPNPDIMKYYNYSTSYLIYPEEKDDDYEEEYVVVYKLSDEGAEIKKQDDYLWHAQFDVRISTNDGSNVEYISVGMENQAPYMVHPEEYDYIKEEWDCGKLKDF